MRKASLEASSLNFSKSLLKDTPCNLQQRPFRRLNRHSLTGPKVWVEREERGRVRERKRGAQQFSFFEKWNFRRGIRVGYYVTAALPIRSVAAQ